MKTQSLNGRWRMAFCDIGAWDVAQAEKALAQADALSAPVPGSVHQGLLEAGRIADPMIADNAQACRFVEEKDFWLQRTVMLEAIDRDAQYLLGFDGIDLDADIYVNGRHALHCDNAFLRWEAEVAALLRDGANTVTVRVNEGLHGVRHKDIGYMRYSWNQDEPYRTWLRKPQYCYGWDWARRLSTCGIWQAVTLGCCKEARLGDAQVRTALEEDHAAATISISPDVHAHLPGAYRVRARLCTDTRYAPDRCVAEADAPAGEAIRLALSAPRLWWPNGAGDPYLYRLTLHVHGAQGQEVDAREMNIGIRAIRFDERPLDAETKRFAVSVNGQSLFAKGANWVPVDQLAGHATQAKYEALILDAKAMHMNMLRVWGGGIYETEAFLDACDRQGILVWHDFMFACGYYPDFDLAFMESVSREAAYQIKRLRNRACFIGWVGNNENHAMYDGLIKHHDANAVYYGRGIYEALLPALCASLDPDRAYRPSSPFGGAYPDDVHAGDQHLWAYNQTGNPRYMDLFAYAETPCTFVSEFGMLAPMNLTTLRRCLDQGQQYPQSPQWKVHSNVGDYFNTLYETFFGLQAASERLAVAQYILVGQALQAECMASVFAQYRARWPWCAGVLLWMYSDCYPTSGWTFVDYYLNRKALYFYTRRAFAPVAFAFVGDEPNLLARMAQGGVQAVEVRLCNDGTKAVAGIYRREVCAFDGQVLAELSCPLSLPPQAVTVVECYSPEGAGFSPDAAVMRCRFEAAQGETIEGRHFFVPFKALQLETPRVRIAAQAAEGGIELLISADTFVWLAHLEEPEGARLTDNDFDIWPGEPRHIRLEGMVDAQALPAVLTMNECLQSIREESV